jgi:hypothetical protein
MLSNREDVLIGVREGLHMCQTRKWDDKENIVLIASHTARAQELGKICPSSWSSTYNLRPTNLVWSTQCTPDSDLVVVVLIGYLNVIWRKAVGIMEAGNLC